METACSLYHTQGRGFSGKWPCVSVHSPKCLALQKYEGFGCKLCTFKNPRINVFRFEFNEFSHKMAV